AGGRIPRLRTGRRARPEARPRMPSWQAAADAGGREPDDVIDHGGEREVLPPRSAEDSGNVPHVHDMHELGDERMDGAAGRAGVETGADRLDRLGQRPVYR